MKKFIFSALLFVSVCAVAQFSDNFSDGRFTSVQSSNRATNWFGNVEYFEVNPALQLQLNAPKDGSPAQLLTASQLSGGTSWEFWLKMDFNPTSSNYTKIYLCSDSPDLINELNGLCLRIGYTNKNIALLSQTGKTSKTLVEGINKRLDRPSASIHIKATLSEKGKFNLYSKLEDEADYVLEGSCQISNIPSSSYFGLICYYTSTRNKHFFFDDFDVKAFDGDDGDIILPEPGNFDAAIYSDIIFNEIMANPQTESPQFVELYNRSSKTFQLKDWKFYYGEKPYSLPEMKIDPDSHFVLCKTTATNDFPGNTITVGVPSFPTLAKTGKLLMLENNTGDLIHWFEYSDKMYRSDEAKSGNFSLESIDPNNLSNTSSNWTASTSPSKGTPGKTNSVKTQNTDIETPRLKDIKMGNADTLLLSFSKPMDRTTLLNKDFYNISNSKYKINNLKTDFPKGMELSLKLNQTPPRGEVIGISLNGITDLSGLDLQETISVGYGFEADSLDIVINELMFNPPTGSNEYIELYNHSKKAIDLSFLSIASRKTDGTLNKAYPLSSYASLVQPEEYLLVTKSMEKVCEFFPCKDTYPFIELATAPVMSNTSGTIVVINNQNNKIIDEFSYNEKMHATGISNKKGISLERISIEKATNDPSNWFSASFDAGNGTPGYINSQVESNGTSNEMIVIESELTIYTYQIKYQFPIPGYRCSMYVYDTSGHLVNVIANNILLGTEGVLEWNGKDSSGQTLQTGIYIIYAEIYNTNGGVKKYKLSVVVK